MQCHALPLLDAIFSLMSMRSSIFSDINQIHEISLARYNHPHTIAHIIISSTYLSSNHAVVALPLTLFATWQHLFMWYLYLSSILHFIHLQDTKIISQNTMPWLLCKPPNCKLSDHFSLSFIYISCIQLHFTISPCTLYIHNRVVSNHISMHVSNGIKSKCL